MAILGDYIKLTAILILRKTFRKEKFFKFYKKTPIEYLNERIFQKQQAYCKVKL
jgi:hypothetical protein